MDRQSSLPSSLIPHLYSAPRNSSTRTTLNSPDDLQRFIPPSPYNFPPPPPLPPPAPPRSSWREGEPGPSSLVHSRYPTRLPSHYDSFGRRNTTLEHDSSFADLIRRDQDRDSYFSFSNSQSTAYQSSHHFQPLPPLIPPLDEPSSSSSFSFDRHDAYSSYPPMGSLSISAPSSAHFTSPESPDIHSTYRSDTRSLDFGSNDEESSHKGKRRRQQSLDTDDNARKSRNPRKTAVACNFCRGRKLRCNGTKPSCYNCTVRKFECEYVPIQRRRGPGKAPKGSRSKKAAATQAQLQPQPTPPAHITDRPPNPVPEYELGSLAPELRPYTSVLSLDNVGFGFHPPDISPNYPPPPDPRLMRQYYSRSRESSEDRSEAEDMFRRMS